MKAETPGPKSSDWGGNLPPRPLGLIPALAELASWKKSFDMSERDRVVAERSRAHWRAKAKKLKAELALERINSQVDEEGLAAHVQELEQEKEALKRENNTLRLEGVALKLDLKSVNATCEQLRRELAEANPDPLKAPANVIGSLLPLTTWMTCDRHYGRLYNPVEGCPVCAGKVTG